MINRTEVFVLNSGVRVVYSESMSTVAHVGFFVDVGSKDEAIGEYGVAHLIEHMLFKGTKSRSAFDIIQDVEGFGGDFNAYTSKEETCVHISIVREFYRKALDVLSDIFYNSCFDENELKKEKHVVFDEIASYEDSPVELIGDSFEEYLFEQTPLAHSVLGNKKDLKTITKKSIVGFYRKYYVNSNIVVSFVGNVPFDEFKSEVEFYFSKETGVDVVNRSKFSCQNARFDLELNRKTFQSHFMLGCKAYDCFDSKRLTFSFLNNMLGGPCFNSILNLSLREKKGLTYNIESNYTPYYDTGMFCIYFGTERNKVEKCCDIIKKEIERLRLKPLPDDQLVIYKNQVIGQLAMSYDNYLSIMMSQARHLMVYGKVESYELLLSKIRQISSKDIFDVANEQLNFDSMSSLLFY